MKSNKLILFLAGICLALTSCNDFLDRLPDDRAELNSLDKVAKFLSSAYGTHSNAFVHEYASDNVTFNGISYDTQPNQEQVYMWKDVTSEGYDDPRSLWSDNYSAVAAANIALEAIDQFLAEGASLEQVNGLRAEALLCRAWAMFRLANVFCMAYNPSHPEYLGLPYPKVAGVEYFERGTLAELYNNINEDIEAALPILSETHMTQPKFHFNYRAAYAFAARFNLFYLNFDKAIEYATKAIGSDPTPVLRKWSQYSSLGAVDLANEFVKSGEASNFMLQTAYSIYGRSLYSSLYSRYAHSYNVISGYETLNAKSIWGSGTSNTALLLSAKQYGSTTQARFPRITEFFEYRDKVGRTGYPHIVEVPFTSGETLLVRAEAYALKNDSINAIKDMQYWLSTTCNTASRYYPILSGSSIVKFMESLEYAETIPEGDLQRSTRKKLTPQGFTIDADGSIQESIVNLILHMRRIETLHTGLRFNDIKRYGITYSHPHSNNPRPKESDPEVFVPGDLRGAIQIPTAVVNAGVAANPR